jgi:hypothetical protein
MNNSQDSQFPGHDSNPRRPEYEAVVLATQLWFYVL